MADMDDVGQSKVGDELGEVVGIGVHVVAGPWLAGTPVATAVMGDRPEPSQTQVEHLVLERVGAQWPAVAEHHRLSTPPVLEVEVRAVARGECAHGSFLRIRQTQRLR
jgi:hypothetical protein